MSKKTFLTLKTNLNIPFVTPSDKSFEIFEAKFYAFNALLFIINFGVLMPFFHKYNHNFRFLILNH
jgi:hypothetical protein